MWFVVITQPTGDGDHHNSDLSPCGREIVSCGVRVECHPPLRLKVQRIKGIADDLIDES